MPKKTKKEKIIAQYRRRLTAFRENARPHPPSLYAYQAKLGASSLSVSAVQPMDHAVRRDLVKTLILAAAAIAGEVVLARILPS
ncbi:hypothetical protein HY339_02330 [Candidatus Gottesmanbacteria bacterium]|nr:hypothetical protein [Candidatus Gottesmanbacteria bacterium]